MPYLIDGHNLISYLPDIELDDPHDEAKLVLKLRGFAARMRKKCVVIFDRGLPGGSSPLSTFSVKVIFAADGQTNADRIIRSRIRNTQDVKGWVVVSSDLEVVESAIQAGMGGMRCAEFAAILNPAPQQKPHPGLDENIKLSPGEVDEWLQVFGMEDSIDEEVRLPKRHKPSAQAEIIRRRSASSKGSATIPDTAQPTQPQNAEPTQPTTHPKKTTKPKQTPQKKRPAAKQNEVDYWIDQFGASDEARTPTDPAPQRRRVQGSSSGANGGKKAGKADAARDAYVDPRMGEAEDVHLGDNTVNAWLDMFGGEPEAPKQPTDPAPQRSDPKKQGRYKNASGKREPTVHKRMSVSDEVYLSDGEVDAWMDVFGVEEDED